MTQFLNHQIARAAVYAATLLFTCGANAQPQLSVAAIGDVPYEPVTNGHQVYPVPPYERLIAHINSDPSIEFTVHIGDIKAGNTLCEDAVYANNVAYFNSFQSELPSLFGPTAARLKRKNPFANETSLDRPSFLQ